MRFVTFVLYSSCKQHTNIMYNYSLCHIQQRYSLNVPKCILNMTSPSEMQFSCVGEQRSISRGLSTIQECIDMATKHFKVLAA